MEFNKSNTRKIMLILCGTIFFAFLLFNFTTVAAVFLWLLNLLTPFIIGFCIAFIVNVPMKAFEGTLFKNKKGRFYRLHRPVSIFLSLFCIVLVITFVVTMLVPEVSATVQAVGDKFPDFVDDIKTRVVKLISDYPDIVDKITNTDINWNSITKTVVAAITNGGSSLISTTFSFASSVAHVIIDVVVGLFFAIYILAQKENLKKQTKGLVYAVMKESAGDRFIKTCAMADETFAGFITGQCLEACILGMMFFVSMSIFRIPYALTVSITIAVTALVPVFGSFMGLAVGAFLILVDNPHKVILFIILFIVLQQIEGNLIYPHVVGGSVGLPSIWVLVAVVVGGDVMGIIGMLIFVPLTSVVYALVREYVVKTLRDRHIPREKYDTLSEQAVPQREYKRKKIKNKNKKEG